MKINTHFYSIEYLDDEGESIVRHAFMTEQQVQILMDEFVRQGVIAQIHDLSPQTEKDTCGRTVMLVDDQTPQLDGSA